MATNEILPFGATSTNVLSQVDYAADAQRLIGHQPGIARDVLENKVLKQTSVMAAGVAQFISDKQANNVTDALTPAQIAAYLSDAIEAGAQNVAIAGGVADALTATYTPAKTAFSTGETFLIRASTANLTATPTLTVDALPAKTIVKGSNGALAAGDIAGAGHWLELQYDSTLDKLVLQNPATGVSAPSSSTVQGAHKNLALSTTGTNALVTVSADELVLGNGAGAYATEYGISGTITTTTTGLGGLDTGVLAASTWYSVWRIGTLAGARGFLFSLSASAPTMPVGYTLKARIGWFRTDGTANKYPLSIQQFGRKVQYKLETGSNLISLPSMAAGASGSTTVPTWSAVATGNFVPSTASAIYVVAGSGNGSAQVIVAPNNKFGGSASTTNQPPICINYTSTSMSARIAIETPNIYYASSAAGSLLNCFGWEDNI